MASNGKKGKRHKGKTLPLTDFLAENSTANRPGHVVVCRKTWGDEVENDEDFYGGSRMKHPLILPTAPRESRTPREVDERNIPRTAPFKAYIVNLHYDTTEDDIVSIFGDMKIVDIQLPRDERGGGRLKGFGYIEFETRDDLLMALSMEDTLIRGRRMRIEVSTNVNDERHVGGSSERKDYEPDRTLGDWRSGPRKDTNFSPQHFARSTGESDEIKRDRGTFTRDNMDGPMSLRRDHRDTGLSRDKFRDHGNSSGYFRERQSTYSSPSRQENTWGRNRYHGDGEQLGVYENSANNQIEHKTRPKLVLAQRSSGIEKTSSIKQSSIFGEAKPVDTSGRERKAEEKIAQQWQRSILRKPVISYEFRNDKDGERQIYSKHETDVDKELIKPRSSNGDAIDNFTLRDNYQKTEFKEIIFHEKMKLLSLESQDAVVDVEQTRDLKNHIDEFLVNKNDDETHIYGRAQPVDTATQQEQERDEERDEEKRKEADATSEGTQAKENTNPECYHEDTIEELVHKIM